MDFQQMSMLSSLKEESKMEDYIEPHYRESYRLAIDHLLSGGRESYHEFLKEERLGSFLADEEILFITNHAEQHSSGNQKEDICSDSDSKSSTGTYWPIHSDVQTPDLDLGWPEVMHDRLQTKIDLLFHPPRQDSPTIKEVIRRHIKDARQVIAIVMDMFTDVDIFKEAVDASLRGVPVYILLDDFNLKSFLTMAENQCIKMKQLRNMRVRTVKGQNYLCRSGATFHGAMEQKFILVDCQTAVYGSYSYMWSFEKINLSMVQVITGHLVESYDEEFRTLYARSTVPAGLDFPEGLTQDVIKQNGRQIMAKYPFHANQNFERKDQLRHTLDTLYRKTCDRQKGMRDFEERLYEEEPIEDRPMFDYETVPNMMPPPKSAEMMDYFKRHSYAGERQDVSYIPQNTKYRASNWNIARDGGFPSGRNYPTPSGSYSQVPQVYRGQNLRQSSHGNDKEVISMHKNMPTLENTSKSFMRTWRIESYLKNHDAPFGDSSDYLDQCEPPEAKAVSLLHSRMRSSLIFKSTIPEQPEMNSYANNFSTGVDFSARHNSALHYSSMQWNPTAEDRTQNKEFILKRQSMQMLDNLCHNSERVPHHSIYASLGRAKGGVAIKNIDISTDSWNKRHSVADPRSNTQYRDDREFSSRFANIHTDRSTVGVNMHTGGNGSNLNEEQRSVSHYDVKSIIDPKHPAASPWQEPPSRTVSAADLDRETKGSSFRSTNMTSPRFLKKSSKKIRSLLKIPDKKDILSHPLEVVSLKSSGSTDTLLAEDEEQKSQVEKNLKHTITDSIRSHSMYQKNQFTDDHRRSLSPGFRVEENRQNPLSTNNLFRTQSQGMSVEKKERSHHESSSLHKDQGSENRLYSRFEPMCALEKKQSSRFATGSGSQDKTKSTTNEQSRMTYGQHENKLGKFIQRVGNFIHKNK